MRSASKVSVGLAVAVTVGLAGPAKTQVVEQAQLKPVGIAAGDKFGYSVSTTSSLAAVGAYGDDDHGSEAGRAYLFGRNTGGGDNWGQFASLVPTDPAAGDQFGWSISNTSNLAIIGAPGDDDQGPSAGSAYVFSRQGGVYTQTAKLLPAAVTGGDNFGFSASITTNFALVGTPYDDDYGPDSGAAYLFGRNTGGVNNWGLIKKLYAGDPTGGDYFGQSVSVVNNFLIVGAPGADDTGPNSGAAYVFGRNTGGGGNWGQAAKLLASDATDEDLFGWSVSISQNFAVVGAPDDDDQGLKSGSAYIFNRDEGGHDNWGQVKKLMGAEGTGGDMFGWSVSIDGELVVSGAKGDDDYGLNSGSAYAFGRNTGGPGNWGQIDKFYASNPSQDAAFGTSVSVNARIICVGAPDGLTYGLASGAGYTYHAPEPAAVTLIGLGGMVLLMKKARKRPPARTALGEAGSSCAEHVLRGSAALLAEDQK